MISGMVTADLEARLRLGILDSDGNAVEGEFVVDTGFTGSISLPPTTLESLRIPFVAWREVTLADDSVVKVPIHEGTVLWNGKEKIIRIHCLKGTPLLGMSLLFGHRFMMDTVADGPLTISELG